MANGLRHANRQRIVCVLAFAICAAMGTAACGKKSETPAPSGEAKPAEQVSPDVAYAAYGKMLDDYLEKYGSPRIVSDESAQTVSGDGVCLAESVDFDGDGLDELYVAYYNPEKESAEHSGDGHDPDAYVVEVWSYLDGEAVVAYQGRGARSSKQGHASCERVILDSDDKGSGAACWINSRSYKGSDYESSLWSIAEGTSKLEHKWECVGESTSKERWLADGKETDLDESHWRDSIGGEWRTYALMDSAKDEHVSECIDMTVKTMDTLGIAYVPPEESEPAEEPAEAPAEEPEEDLSPYTIHFTGADLVLPEAMRGVLDPTITEVRGNSEHVGYAGFNMFLNWTTDVAWLDQARESGGVDYSDASSETLPDGTQLNFGVGNDLVCQVEIVDPAGNRGILTTFGFSDFSVDMGMDPDMVASCRGLQDAVTGGSAGDDPVDNAFAFLRECAKGLSFT